MNPKLSIRVKISIIMVILLAGAIWSSSVFISHSFESLPGTSKTISSQSLIDITLAYVSSALVATILISVFLTFTVTKPLKKLNQSIIQLGQGEFKKVGIRSNDEIGELAESFNKIASELENSKRKVEEYSENLEKQVKEKTAELKGKVIEMENSKTAMLNIMEDMDESNKETEHAKKQLEKAIKSLKKLDVQKNEFLSIAAHELKTPLTSIHGFSQLLKTGKLSEKKRQQYLEIMENETLRLAGLITDMLELSRADLGTIRLIIEPINIYEMLENLKNELGLKTKNKKLKLEFELEKDLPKIGTDKEKLYQILINLVGNAIKYTEKGRITVKVRKVNEHLKFQIKDTGVGIPKEHHKKIFSRFFQVDSSYTRKVGGTGLGLSICKEYVNMLGGDIGFESAEGRGSTFYFKLPIKNKSFKGIVSTKEEEDIEKQ